jgi:two-component system, NarL family, invasion response regulator UvrY
MIRLLCVDDNEAILYVMQRYLNRAPDVEVIGTLSSATDLEAAVRDEHPDIVVLDLDMPGENPLEVLRRVNGSGAAARTVIFSGHIRSALVAEAMDAGAWGYVSKNNGEAELLAAIRRIVAGNIAWSPEVRAVLAQR